MGCRSETGASAKASVWRAPPPRSILASKGRSAGERQSVRASERTTVEIEIEVEIEVEIEIDTYRNPVIHVVECLYCSTI